MTSKLVAYTWPHSEGRDANITIRKKDPAPPLYIPEPDNFLRKAMTPARIHMLAARLAARDFTLTGEDLEAFKSFPSVAEFADALGVELRSRTGWGNEPIDDLVKSLKRSRILKRRKAETS